MNYTLSVQGSGVNARMISLTGFFRDYGNMQRSAYCYSQRLAGVVATVAIATIAS